MKRRHFIKIASTLTAGLAIMTSPITLFAKWNEKAFKSDNFDAALKSFFGTSEHTASGDVSLKAADIAENGLVVPVTISSKLPNIDSMAVLVSENPSPLAAGFKLSEHSIATVSTRLKMGKSSNVYAVVQSNGKLFSTFKEVKVTIGGCGG